jgi:NADP-dependent 3-hydroxy acid dehydrogenase YdfG
MEKIIVITGVSKGLGRVMTEMFIQSGHRVAGCARDLQAIESLKSHFAEGQDFTALDIRDEKAVKQWSRNVISMFGPPDLLINNAGAAHAPAPFWEINHVLFDRVIDINIKGMANVLRHFMPAMIQQKQGVIVNFSAGWGRYTAANASAYCASKWAVEGLTGALAKELPKGMAAVSLWPGTIHTETLELTHGREKAENYLTPELWSKRAADFLLGIGASDNGKQLSIPTG